MTNSLKEKIVKLEEFITLVPSLEESCKYGSVVGVGNSFIVRSCSVKCYPILRNRKDDLNLMLKISGFNDECYCVILDCYSKELDNFLNSSCVFDIDSYSVAVMLSLGYNIKSKAVSNVDLMLGCCSYFGITNFFPSNEEYEKLVVYKINEVSKEIPFEFSDESSFLSGVNSYISSKLCKFSVNDERLAFNIINSYLNSKDEVDEEVASIVQLRNLYKLPSRLDYGHFYSNLYSIKDDFELLRFLNIKVPSNKYYLMHLELDSIVCASNIQLISTLYKSLFEISGYSVVPFYVKDSTIILNVRNTVHPSDLYHSVYKILCDVLCEDSLDFYCSVTNRFNHCLFNHVYRKDNLSGKVFNELKDKEPSKLRNVVKGVYSVLDKESEPSVESRKINDFKSSSIFS